MTDSTLVESKFRSDFELFSDWSILPVVTEYVDSAFQVFDFK